MRHGHGATGLRACQACVCRDRLAKAAAEPAAGRARAQVRTAYEVLSDPLLRALYDTKLSAGGRSGDLDDDAAAAGANGARARRSRAPPTLRPLLASGPDMTVAHVPDPNIVHCCKQGSARIQARQHEPLLARSRSCG